MCKIAVRLQSLLEFSSESDLPSRLAASSEKGMELDLTDDETAALGRLLSDAIDRDRWPLSPRIKMLRGILAKSALTRAAVSWSH